MFADYNAVEPRNRRFRRSIVEAHQGTLALQSALGLGTTVNVRLPRRG